MSQTPNKSLQKMCKSPKNTNFHIKQEKIEYENMSTNCTVVGSNNLNLVKKPQLLANVSPAYSMPSPNYPQSPYSSPASLKSPSPSLKPPTPQPNFPLMQIIHNNLVSRPLPAAQPQNIIKLKPHLNILPKPSASPQPSPKPSVSPQIVIPTGNQQSGGATATLMPTAQPLLLNQMQMLAAPGVQFILRPQTATQMATAAPKLQYSSQANSQAPQGLILQPACAPQQLLHLGAPARSQPMVRVLANGVQLAPSTTTYVTTQMPNQPINATHIQQTIVNNAHQQQQHQQHQQHIQIQQHVLKKKPKVKVKKKLDLANIMKLSGIGDEDDIQFESDTSQSESDHNSVPTTPQPQQPVTPTGSVPGQHMGYAQPDSKKNIQNIQISSMPQPTINTPVVQLLNQNFQSGMISNSSSQATAAAHANSGLPFNSTFITPNFTINNGLMLQRSSGFKLTVGEDGRLVLQHDPALNQELQNQLILQSLLGLNGSLVLQPSMDQQTVQQTVQTIQQQSVQTIQQQTVQSQTIQTVQQQTVQPQVQHTIQSLQPQIQQQTVQQTIQHQTVNALQQPMQIVQPQPIHSLHSQVPTVHSISQSQVHNLQSQIQSLLQQQQNIAVQAQAVHQNVPQNVHSQAMQNLQNVQSMAQGSVQNMSQSAAASVVAQSAAVQNMTQGVQSVQNMPPTPAQPIQTSVHSVQGFQQAHTQTTQPVLKVQPFLKSQPPVQTVQPIQHHSHPQQHNNMQQENHQPNPPSNSTSYVVNLTPEQLEQLKRNGQVTVNGQTIFMQRPNKDQGEKKLSPKMKSVKKVSEINKIQGIKSLLQDNVQGMDSMGDRKPAPGGMEQMKTSPPQHVKPVSSPVAAQPHKHILPHNHVQPLQNKPPQPQAMVQPSVQHVAKMDRQKSPLPSPKQQKVSPTIHSLQDSNGTNSSHDVDKLLGQILEESGGALAANGGNNHNLERQPQQRITTIQLTPQKQQHLKTIQMQIQTLSARLQPGDTEVHNALKRLFAEQQKILASGKLLPPDKVYYLNNQLTIVNPSTFNLPSPVSSVKSEPPSPGLSANHSISRSNSAEASPPTPQPISSGAQSHTSPRVSVSVSTSTGDLPAHSTIHHHPSQAQLHHVAPVGQQQAPHVPVNHPNHVINQRLNAINQVSQLPPLYSKQAQLHSPQLHSPNLQQVNSPQLPSPQPPQLHNAQGPPNQLHLQPNQISPAQAVKPKQPSPIPQQAKNQHALNQQLYQQQQQQQQHFQHQHLLNQQAHKQQTVPTVNQQLSQARKAHLIESQLVVDQQGATNPNVHQPFRDKRDACIRLMRYHCLDQPVLSEQDLHKADENFELNAQHYITKFDRMIDKYKYLLIKESMRHVQTSELMMLDRMFLADEQQSLIKLRQDYEAEYLSLVAEPTPNAAAQDKEATGQQHSQQNETESCNEEYDEWACIQRELGCLSDLNHHPQHPSNNHHHSMGAQVAAQCTAAQNQYNSLKRTSSSDSRLETLKRFRVDKHTKKHEPLVISGGVQCSGSVMGKGSPGMHNQSKCGYESNSSQANSSYSSYKEEESENNSIDEQVQSAINSILNLQQTQLQQQNSLDLDSILS
uniref:GLTSCR protein conserved domain-containing protein n=2 Tax=Dendroctonus ponderosae TaxID=77166 RepID=A0AAR5Q4C1_DENPD